LVLGWSQLSPLRHRVS
jgi:predicted cupin superfamily sugar epimerase